MPNLEPATPKPQAGVGWFFCGLSFIPLFGVLFGFIAIIIGAVNKVKGQILLGIAGILFTVTIYGSLYYFGSVATTGIFPDLKIKLTYRLINTNAGQIALYKNQHGKLPKKLSELNNEETFFSTDPWGTKFSYTPKSDGSFELRSAGPDKILNTNDDILQTFTADH